MVKKFLKAIANTLVFLLTRTPGISHIFIGALKYIANYGKGSNFLAKRGVMVFPIHFYYPTPDVNKLEASGVFDRVSTLSGIDFKQEAQLEFLKEISKEYQKECNFSASKTANEEEFFTENGCFSYGCAAILYCVVRKYKPKKIIEVGVGNSSKIINQAVELNLEDGLQSINYVAIDPFPPRYVSGLKHLTSLKANAVEDIDVEFFKSLEENDLLFIDSSHQVKIGNDVVFLFLEILPLLNPGVIVHIHDIGLLYEYPRAYFLNERFRVCWNEQYLLQALLIDNPKFKVLYGAANIMTNYPDKFKEAFSLYDPEIHKASSGSFWIQRTLA